jgi:tetratricopeptide (TPR) repeat protein
VTASDSALDLLNSGHIAESIPPLREAALCDPSYKSFLNYGIALRYSGDFTNALIWLAKAVCLDTRPPNAFLALGNVSTELGEWDHALGYYESAFYRVSHQQSGADAIRQVAIAYASALMRAHRFSEAWPLWELGRFNRSYFALPGTQQWLGQPCDSLLVVCEGGYGDAMLYGRWLPLLHTRARYVSLLIWDRMTDFRSWKLLGVDEVISQSTEMEAANTQYTTSWMSLPAIFGMKSVADIPPDDALRNAYDMKSERIGYCWRAEENLTLRPVRSLDDDSAQSLADALANYGEVTSLAPSKLALYTTKGFVIPSGILQDESLIAGWRVTAQTIRSCKLVVTVDTAVAHLAGLCGVPTLILLPCNSDQKWGTADNQPTDPWYGAHVHYYRNADPHKWNVEEIASCAASTITS